MVENIDPHLGQVAAADLVGAGRRVEAQGDVFAAHAATDVHAAAIGVDLGDKAGKRDVRGDVEVGDERRLTCDRTGFVACYIHGASS